MTSAGSARLSALKATSWAKGVPPAAWRVARIALPMVAVQPASPLMRMFSISKVEWSSSSRVVGRKITEPRRRSLVARSVS